MSVSIAPNLGYNFRLYLKHKGKHKLWPAAKYNHYYSRSVAKTDKSRTYIEVHDMDPQPCRETLTNSIYYTVKEAYEEAEDLSLFDFESNKTQESTITLAPNRGKIPAISLNMGMSSPEFASADIFNDMGDSCDHDYCVPLYAMLTDNKSMHRFVRMLDLFLGSAAMYCRGPGAYVRRGKQKLEKTIVATSATYDSYGYGYSYDSYCDYCLDSIEGCENCNDKPKEFKHASAWLNYNGLSADVLLHPALLSFILGIKRFCLELYLVGKFDAIEKKLETNKALKRLDSMSKQSELSREDNAELLSYIKLLKPYTSSKHVKKNPGAYPLNEYTWSMLPRFAKAMRELSHDDLYNYWMVIEDNNSIYGVTNYGFLKWCAAAAPTKKFSAVREAVKSNAGKWSGTNGDLAYI